MITRTPSHTDGHALTLDEVRASAPAAFASHASNKMSDRYAFVSTIQAIQPLLDSGFEITGCSQRATRRRNPSHTRHLLRLRPGGIKPIVGDVFPEVVLINSHDGQSKFSVLGGFFRLACANGLVVPMSVGGKPGLTGSYLRRHVGDAKTIVADSLGVIEAVKGLSGVVIKMTKKKLTEKQQTSFAIAASKIAYGEDVNFDPKLLLGVRRDEDKGASVWTVYNRVQENLVKGGIQFEVNHRPITTRGITHIGRNTELNLDLWDLAVKVAA